MQLEPEDVQQAPEVAAFIAEVRHWREVVGCSQKKLAALVGYTPSYVSKVERGRCWRAGASPSRRIST